MDGNRGSGREECVCVCVCVCVCESGLCVPLIFPIALNEGGVATCFL